MKTLEWINKKEGVSFQKNELLYIRDFALVWNMFETALDNPIRHTELTIKVKEFEEGGRFNGIDCSSLVDYFKDRYTGELNSSGLNLANREDVFSKLDNGGDHIISQALLPVILRVRNNLFHGNKAIHHIEGQQELFEQIIDFLKLLIDAIDEPKGH